MTRRRQKMDVNNEATCLWCHQPMSYDVAYRSRTWYGGIVGVRAVLCSPEHVDLWDAGQQLAGSEATA